MENGDQNVPTDELCQTRNDLEILVVVRESVGVVGVVYAWEEGALYAAQWLC